MKMEFYYLLIITASLPYLYLIKVWRSFMSNVHSEMLEQKEDNDVKMSRKLCTYLYSTGILACDCRDDILLHN
jgi:hypothetical protein